MQKSLPHRLAAAVAWVMVLVSILPVLVTLPAAFTDKPYLSLPTVGAWSLIHIETFFKPEALWISAFLDSTLIGILTMVLTLVLAIPAAIGIWRLDGIFGKVLLLTVMVPMMVPLVAVGLGTYSVWVRIGLFDTYAGLVIAHSIQALPFAVIPLLGVLSKFDRSLEDAAAIHGASSWQFIWDIVVPGLRPAMGSAAVLAFMVSWSELVVALFATGRNVNTLPKRLWSATFGLEDPVVAVAVAFMTLITAAILIFRALRSSN